MNANKQSLAEEISEGFKALETIRQQQVRIDQLLETQDYLYKRHDEQQAELQDHRQIIFWLMENHPDIWQTILEVRILESMQKKAQEK